VTQLVQALRYKAGGRGFDSRWRHWNFSLTQSFRPHYGPGVYSASNRNEYQECFLWGGVKAAGAWSWQLYHLLVPNVFISGSLNLLEPSRPVRACNGIDMLPPHTSRWCRHCAVCWYWHLHDKGKSCLSTFFFGGGATKLTNYWIFARVHRIGLQYPAYSLLTDKIHIILPVIRFVIPVVFIINQIAVYVLSNTTIRR